MAWRRIREKEENVHLSFEVIGASNRCGETLGGVPTRPAGGRSGESSRQCGDSSYCLLGFGF